MVKDEGLAIVYDQDIIWSKSFGYTSLTTKTPVTSNTVFRIGSITKLFTATMLMQLRDAGLLRLDQSVDPFIPVDIDAPFTDPRPINFRQLSSHTSGFPPEGGDYWQTLKIPSIKQLYAENPIIHLEHPSFTSMSYSNFGVSVMGDVLASISNMPYEKYVTSKIFKPLKMVNSAFSPSDFENQIIAVGYTVTTGKQVPVENINLNALTPAGQSYSSVNDLSKFISLQFREGTSSDGQILSGSSLREMHHPVYLFPEISKPNSLGFAVGIGWFIRNISGYHAVGHGGGIPGYSADITLVPNFKIGVVTLTNGGISEGNDPTSLNKEILEKIVPAIATAKRNIRLKKAFYRKVWGKYLGEYDLVGVAKLYIVKQSEFMALVHPLDKPEEAGILVPKQENTFVLEGGIAHGAKVDFKVDETGKITGLTVVGIFAPKL